MPKAVKKTQATPADVELEIVAANAGLLAPTATDLLCLIENGEDNKATARIQSLGRENFIAVSRSLQKLNEALAAYAQSWQGVELP